MKKLTSLFLLSVILGNTILFNIQLAVAQGETGESETVQSEVQPEPSPLTTEAEPMPDLQPVDDNANSGLSDEAGNAFDVQQNGKDENIQSRARAGINGVFGSDPKTEPIIPSASSAIPTDPLTFLKGLNGNFSTDLFTGAAVFNYDFWLPRGRGFAQPVVSLRYSSHNRNFSSFVGYGWSLPTNGIFRSTPKGVDKLYVESIFSSDIFGRTEELISVNSSQGLYAPKTEGSFVEYKYVDNARVAVDVNGARYFFGGSSDSRQEDPDDSLKIYKWLLERVEDANGNYLTITYFHDQRQVYPQTIRYSGHGTDEGIYEVVFNWQNRDMSATSYSTGFKAITAYRLSSLDIISHHDSTPKTARSYFFEYDKTGKVVETLKSVSISDGSISLPPILFEYFDSSESEQKIHLLKKITNIHGGITELRYKPSTFYRTQDFKLANSNLPFNIHTIRAITTTDPVSGVSSTSTYDYSGGHYYYDYADAYKKEYAGFAQVSITDAKGNITKHFFHQSEFSYDNEQSETMGEYQDHISKKGRIYRADVYDNAGNLFTASIKKWDKKQLADDDENSERFFPYLERTTEIQYDGNQSARSMSEEFAYDDFGNVITKTDYGEVQAIDNAGNFNDIGNDKIITFYQYAQSLPKHILSLPSFVESRDGANNVIARTKDYYDNLDLGGVNIGNLTKQEKYYEDSKLIAIQKSYNSYGLVESETDPRGNITSYTYDQFNLFPKTITNAKKQAASYTYDYLVGKATQTIDPNGQIFQTVYDGFGRKRQEKQPDINNPAVLVLSSSYVYNDTILPASIIQTNYLDDVNNVEQMTYLDGFDRVIQTKTASENGNIYSTKDVVYNNLGQVEKESLPYFSTGFAKTLKTTNNNLYTSYVYDPLNRIISSTNAVGTTLNSYDDWKVSATDAKNNVKSFYSDVYGNLVKIGEYNGAEIYITQYEYDLLGNLIKITDAKNNVKNFAYDYLGRLKFLEDLHTQADTTLGTINYDYDDAGNLIKKIDGKNETTIYDYDELNRVKTEDNTSKAGVETSYTYDVCANGVGRLCAETNSDESTDYSYNALGLVDVKTRKQENKETKQQEQKQEKYEYDRQGNVALTVYPNNSQVKNEYNSAGQIEKTSRKESSESIFSDVIVKIDYNPLGQMKYQENANGTATANTYDENELYRLRNKKTEIVGDPVETEQDNETKKQENYVSKLIDKDAEWNDGVHNNTAADEDNLILKVVQTGETLLNSESFETSLGKWQNSATDTCNWLRDSNGTSPRGTGPKTGKRGRYYAYVETSKGYCNKVGDTAIFEYRLLTPVAGRIEFYYNMYGKNIGELRVDSYDGSNWTTIWQLNGNQGARWSEIQIAAFQSGATKLRFHYTAGGGNLGDAAIDWIRVYQENSGYASSGSWISESLAMNVITNVGGSKIEWSEILPANAKMQVYTGINVSPIVSPTAWDAAANGGEIRNIAGNLAGKYLWSKIEMTSGDAAYTPKVEWITYKISNKEPIRVDVLQDLSYTYDEVGNITKIVDASQTDSAKTSDFEYDDLYRLKKVTATNTANGQNYTQTYDYDAIGNITNKSDVGDYLYEGNLGNSYANPHAVTRAGDKIYTYDKNGNLISNGVWTHTWDYNNRLIQSTNGVKTITYGYDTSGNRVSKSDGTKTTYYFSKHYEIENGKVKKHIYSAGGKVATIDDGKIIYHHVDHLTGSNAETNADGNMVEVIDYYPFGSVRVDDSFGGYENDYKFTGKELDDDTGLYYYGARYYDGGVGRFVGVDPAMQKNLLKFLSDPQQLNSYSYTRNNPLKYIDPTGESAILAGITGLAVAYGPEISSTFFGAISTITATLGLKQAVANQVEMVDAYLSGDAGRVQQRADAQKGTFLKQLAGQFSNLIIGDFVSPTKNDDSMQAGEQQILQGSDTWGNHETLNDHFERHGSNFGAISHDDYINKASDFFRDSQSRGLPTKIDNGIIRVYDESANTFGAYNADGTTKTFFKPDPSTHRYPTNLDYWSAQRGNLVEQKGGGLWTP